MKKIIMQNNIKLLKKEVFLIAFKWLFVWFHVDKSLNVSFPLSD